MITLFDKGISAYENKSYPAAYEYFEEAAVEKNKDAMVNLAIMHMKGVGCDRDLNLAKKWFEEAVL